MWALPSITGYLFSKGIMTLTVLLDLDDTLLVNDINKFLPAYLQALSSFLDDLAPDETIRQVMMATRQMEKNRDPSRTLEEVFDASFYPGLGVNKKDIWDKIVRFYTDVFPTLQKLTVPNPGAIDLVNYLFKKGHQVIIATNPYFPRAATVHRLAWAGNCRAAFWHGFSGPSLGDSGFRCC